MKEVEGELDSLDMDSEAHLDRYLRNPVGLWELDKEGAVCSMHIAYVEAYRALGRLGPTSPCLYLPAGLLVC
jgi:hypothetical protein